MFKNLFRKRQSPELGEVLSEYFAQNTRIKSASTRKHYDIAFRTFSKYLAQDFSKLRVLTAKITVMA